MRRLGGIHDPTGLLSLIRRPATGGDNATRWGVVSAWNLADLTDSIGTNTLTNNNGVTFVSGKVGNGANFVGASSQYLSRASNATLQAGDVDQWYAAWFNPTTVASAALVAKASNDNALSDYEWALYRFADGKVGVVLGNGAAGQVLKTTAAYTAPGWAFAFGYYDATAQTLNVSLDAGAFASAARTLTPAATAKPFAIGSSGGLAAFHSGLIDAAAFGKSPPLGITALATEIRDALYNAGSGLEPPY